MPTKAKPRKTSNPKSKENLSHTRIKDQQNTSKDIQDQNSRNTGRKDSREKGE